jgi:hypothetical protein
LTATQRSRELARAFEVPHDAHCPQLLATVLYDLCRRLPLGATITGHAGNEREELGRMLPHLQRGDVLVLDRGYPSFAIFQTLCEAGIDFVVRVPRSHTFEAVDLLRQSPGNDYRVLLAPRSKRDQPIELSAAGGVPRRPGVVGGEARIRGRHGGCIELAGARVPRRRLIGRCQSHPHVRVLLPI